MIKWMLICLSATVAIGVIFLLIANNSEKKFKKDGWFKLLFNEDKQVKLKTRDWVKTDELVNSIFWAIKSKSESNYYNASYINSYKEMFKVGLETYMKDDWYEVDSDYRGVTHIFKFLKKDYVSSGDVNEFLTELLSAIKEENHKINKMEKEASDKEIENFKVASQRCIDIVKNMRSEIENMSKIGEKTT